MATIQSYIIHSPNSTVFNDSNANSSRIFTCRITGITFWFKGLGSFISKLCKLKYATTPPKSSRNFLPISCALKVSSSFIHCTITYIVFLLNLRTLINYFSVRTLLCTQGPIFLSFTTKWYGNTQIVHFYSVKRFLFLKLYRITYGIEMITREPDFLYKMSTL